MPNVLLDASLVADQYPQEGMFAQVFSRATASGRTHSLASRSQAGYALSMVRYGEVDPEQTTIDAHIAAGRRVVQGLERSRLRVAEMRRFQDSMRWLDKNRSSFGGQWVALDGEKLLAADASAKQVFSEVGDLEPVPLVIRVEQDETPFAGW